MSLETGREVKKYAWSVDFAVDHFRESSLYSCDEGKYVPLIEKMIKVMQDWSVRWSLFAASKSFLNHRSFLSEMEESVVPIQTLLDCLSRRCESRKDAIVVVDLCSGKGFMSLMLSYLAIELPLLKQHIGKILMVDSCFGRGKNSINTDYLNVVENERTTQTDALPVGCVSGNLFDPWFVRSLLNAVRGPHEFMSDITAAPVFKGSFTLTDIKKRLPIESLREMLAERGELTTGTPDEVRIRLLAICQEGQQSNGLDACSKRFEFNAGADSMGGFLVKGACRDWNKGCCSRKHMCKFKHVCAHCAAQDHPAVECALLPDFTKQAISRSILQDETKVVTVTMPSSPFIPPGLAPALPQAYMLEMVETQPLNFSMCSPSQLRCKEIAYVLIGQWFIAAECAFVQGDTPHMLLPSCPKYLRADPETEAVFASRTLALPEQTVCFRLTSSKASELTETSSNVTSVDQSGGNLLPVGSETSLAVSAAPVVPEIVFLGVHLCQRLSPRCVEIFNSVPSASLLVLAPCCLPPRNMAPMLFGSQVISPIAIHLAEKPYEAWVDALLVALQAPEKGIVQVPLTGGIHRRNCYTYASKMQSS